MQKITLFMMVSLDGYFEGPGHDLSWHNVDGEFNEFANAQLGEFGSLLFGHRTYDLMAGYWPTGEEAHRATGKLMNAAVKFVAAHEPFAAGWAGTTVLAGADAEVHAQIAKLKEQEGKGILLLGSNMLCVSLMEAGLVDEFRIMVNPVAIGAGTPLFKGLSKRTKFTLASVREFTSGNVLNYYHPIKAAA